jgi:hypothetical protein
VQILPRQNLEDVVPASSTANSATPGNAVPVAELNAMSNPAITDVQYLRAGNSDVKVGSYLISASPAEAIALKTLIIQWNGYPQYAQSLRVEVNGVPFGAAYAQLASDTAYSFAGNTPITIPANGWAVVDVYVDAPIVPGGQSIVAGPLTTMESCSGTALNSGTGVSCGAVPLDGPSFNIIPKPSVEGAG